MVTSDIWWKRPGYVCVLIGAIGLAVLLPATAATNPAKPFFTGGDANQYLAIGENIAQGNGYRDTASFWPGSPAYDRMPVWPFILSIALKMAPAGSSPEAVSRFTNAVFLALAGAAFGFLCSRLGLHFLSCLLAGLSVSLSPILIYYGNEGMSEISFVLIVGAGLALAFSGSRYVYPAALLMGLGPLIRTNFVLVPLLCFGIAFGIPVVRREFAARCSLSRALLAVSLMLLPTVLWAIRNYAITGRPLLLSSLEGEAWYGSNNDATANNLRDWGYWVFPDVIPGETPKAELAKRLSSDLAVNDYYRRKGLAWIRNHVSAMPRLIVGKLVRAFVPIPWADSPSAAEFAAFIYLFALRVSFWALAPHWWPRMNREYLLILGAIGICHLITTVLFYGSARLSYCFFDVFSLPCVYCGFEHWLALRQQRR